MAVDMLSNLLQPRKGGHPRFIRYLDSVTTIAIEQDRKFYLFNPTARWY
jgi:hypothetical protein